MDHEEINSNQNLKKQNTTSNEDIEFNENTSAPVTSIIDEMAMASFDVTQKINHLNIHADVLIDLIETEINEIRFNKGLKSLSSDRLLDKAAADQNKYQTNKSSLDHYQDNDEKRTISDRVKYYGGRFSSLAENVQYYGFLVKEMNGEKFIIPPDYNKAAVSIVENWISSPSHYRNLINPEFSRLGSAVEWNEELTAIFVTQVYAD